MAAYLGLRALAHRRAARVDTQVHRGLAAGAVSVANSSSWLVAYYERSGQMTRAYDLAQRAAAAFSASWA